MNNFNGLLSFSIASGLLVPSAGFSTKKDPNEMINRIDDPVYVDVVIQMRSRLLAHLAQCEDNKI